MPDVSTTQVYQRPRDAIRRLQQAGVVHGIDEANLDQLRAECWDDDEDRMEDAGLLGILTMHYETIERGRADGFYWRDDQFWQQTEDVVAELAALLPDDPPLFVQRSVSEKLSTTRGFKESFRVLELARDDGKVETLEARSLDDVVAAFNVLLKERGQPRRIVPLDTSGEWRMYVAMDLPLARQLAAEGVLPVDDMEGLVD
jgi:hypothetical protein